LTKNYRIILNNEKSCDKDMIEYLEQKTNPKAFIKDLIYREMLRDMNYISCNIGQNTKMQNFTTQNSENNVQENNNVQNFDFDIDDLDI
jgi:hypothetical protein